MNQVLITIPKRLGIEENMGGMYPVCMKKHLPTAAKDVTKCIAVVDDAVSQKT